MRLPVALVLVIALADVATAQSAVGEAPEYPTATAALNALRGKSGVNISMQSGWTVIEDKSTLSLWSFTLRGTLRTCRPFIARWFRKEIIFS
jgi:hypothetical protein